MRTAHMIAHSAPVIGEQEIEAVARVLRSGHLSQGSEVEAFEEECAEFVGRRFGVAVSSGTAALHLALDGLGVDAETTVAMPAYACASLMTAVSLQRARAFLCDVGPDFNMREAPLADPDWVVVLPHLFGKAAGIPRTGTVIEDIAQSIGGDTGTRSRVAIASFYATKLMTTGEGGMVLTDDADLAEHVRDRRDYDNRDDFAPRFCYKLTDFQAALGRVQLRRLPEFIARRRDIAYRYLEALSDLPLELPHAEGHVFFRFVVGSERREELELYLNDVGIESKRPVHSPAHHYFRDRGEGSVRLLEAYPGADRAHECALSLPIHPAILDEDQAHVIDSVRRFHSA